MLGKLPGLGRGQPLEQFGKFADLADQGEQHRLRIVELPPVPVIGELPHAAAKDLKIGHAPSIPRCAANAVVGPTLGFLNSRAPKTGQAGSGESGRQGQECWYERHVTREGPFWDVMEGRAPLPPAAALLGWELVSIDPDAGTIEVAYRADERFLNPVGVIQGGFLTAMLDEAMGPALVASLDPGLFSLTTDLHVQFLRPARPGRLTGRGRVTSRSRSVGFLAGELLNESGQVVAAATATVQIRAIER